MTRSALTEEDLRALVRGATEGERARAATKICQAVDRPLLSAEDRAEAAEILRIMAADASEMVRAALAVTLKSSPLVPRDLANKLARDLESVALPILNFSPAFTDDDLIELVRVGSPVRQAAMAKRPSISPQVCRSLVRHGNETVVSTLCRNEGAKLDSDGLSEAMAKFERSERVLTAIALRRELPLAVTEKLLTLAGASLRLQILQRHKIPEPVADQIATGTVERATIDLIDQIGREANVRAFVSHLHREHRLTPSLLLRALAHGHMAFFEHGLAELAGIPHHRTWLMIHDSGTLGLRAIYERAGLPSRLYSAFRSGVDAYHSIESDQVANDDKIQTRMLQRFLTQPGGVPSEDVDYLLDRLNVLSPPRELLERTGRLV